MEYTIHKTQNEITTILKQKEIVVETRLLKSVIVIKDKFEPSI